MATELPTSIEGHWGSELISFTTFSIWELISGVIDFLDVFETGDVLLQDMNMSIPMKTISANGLDLNRLEIDGMAMMELMW